MVLAIETATTVCGAALVQEGALVALREVAEPHVHAEKLPGLIGAVLQEAGLAPAGLKGVAVSGGPGSFTGLRIGLSTAKGLVYATGIPLVAVPTLETLARRLARSGVCREGWILAALDARRDEVYAQLFSVRDGRPEPATAVSDLSASALPGVTGERSVHVTGDGALKAAEALARAGCPHAVAPEEVRYCTAVETGLMGEQLLHAGERSDPGTLEPRYIKEFFLKAR